MISDQQVLPGGSGNWRDRALLAAILFAALLVRMIALSRYAANLTDDRDMYLALGHLLAEGRGFVDPASGLPTAYRPPLYPLVIAGLFRCGLDTTALGVLQALLGVGTVALTWIVTRQCGLRASAGIAAAIVALDPLLVYYTTWPMTETLYTFLSTALMLCLLRWWMNPIDSRSNSRQRIFDPLLAGALFGLCALCRPTIWSFGILLAAWGLLTTLRHGGFAEFFSGGRWHQFSVAMVATLVIVAPWAVRNVRQLGRPIVTTTHGGYTLLLANNPVVYEQEVRRPWGTVWEDAPAGQRQSDWLADVEQNMKADLGMTESEITRDRWMSERAVAAIRAEPGTFVRACWLRVRRLWNIVPLSPAGGDLSRPVRLGIGFFYATVYCCAILGFIRRPFRGHPSFLIMIISVTLVHSVYWSNARMRAPLMPIVAVLAAAAFPRTAVRNPRAEGSSVPA